MYSIEGVFIIYLECKKVSSSVLQQALDKLTISMNPSLQKRIFNRNIDLFKKSS